MQPKSHDWTGPQTVEALHQHCLDYSAANPGYRLLVELIGFTRIRVCVHKRLPRDARSRVSDSGEFKGGYYLNGKFKKFTTAQIVADQQDWR